MFKWPGHVACRSVNLITTTALMFGLLIPTLAYAANYTISRSTATFDGSRVLPGDTVTLEAGVRGPLKIKSLKGTADLPILIQNDPRASSPVTLRNPTAERGGFLLDCYDCIHVVLDGTKKWVGAPAGAYCGAPNGTDGCGIRILSTAVGDAPTIYLRFAGYSSDFTVRGVEIDGNWPSTSVDGIGIRIGDQDVLGTENPGVWRKNVVFESNYVHEVQGEGFYIGPNWIVDQIRLRNITIRENLVRKTGWEGIQLKSAIEGLNRIEGNVVIDAGAAKDSFKGQHLGIQCYESKCDIIGNLVVRAGESGIGLSTQHLPESYGPLASRIFNNVSVSAGATGPLAGHGITVYTGSGAARYAAKIFNNTVVGPLGNGVNIDGGNLGAEQVVANNLIGDVGGKGLKLPDGTSVARNTIGSTSSLGFIDPSGLDFRLAAGSDAIDTGTGQVAPADDFHGVPRPQGNGPDQGAFEFVADPKPKAPTIL